MSRLNSKECVNMDNISTSDRQDLKSKNRGSERDRVRDRYEELEGGTTRPLGSSGGRYSAGFGDRASSGRAHRSHQHHASTSNKRRLDKDGTNFKVKSHRLAMYNVNN